VQFLSAHGYILKIQVYEFVVRLLVTVQKFLIVRSLNMGFIETTFSDGLIRVALLNSENRAICHLHFEAIAILLILFFP
jgi:hypothetical protein